MLADEIQAEEASLVERIVEAIEGVTVPNVSITAKADAPQVSVTVERGKINLECEITSRDKQGYLKTFTIKSL